MPVPPRSLPVDRVWAGHRVGFELLTGGGNEYVAYYDADRNMKIAWRALEASDWSYKMLPSQIGWDSHNYIVMALDRTGHLHVSGNMHVDPLVYFRAGEPGDIASLERVPAMTGQEEDRVTYPRFLHDHEGRLIFSYRSGQSGNGVNYYNVYDEKTRTWSRLLDTPLFDGDGKMNAYPLGPEEGPDDWFHMSWVWRDTIDASTNHDLHYARSKDLIHWENVGGQAVALPIRPEETSTLIDPVPVRGGIINGSGDLGFDAEGKIVIAYHKFDADGKTQLYFARPAEKGWGITQASDWDYRWEIEGGGSLNIGIRHSGVRVEKGELVINLQHPKIRSGPWRIDPVTWQLDRRLPNDPMQKRIGQAVGQVRSSFPEMETRTTNHEVPEKNKTHVLRWESLPAFGDLPRPKPWPDPSDLELLIFETPASQPTDP